MDSGFGDDGQGDWSTAPCIHCGHRKRDHMRMGKVTSGLLSGVRITSYECGKCKRCKGEGDLH